MSRGVEINIELIGMSERETLVELPWAADCCPRVLEKLRTVSPLTVGIRDAREGWGSGSPLRRIVSCGCLAWLTPQAQLCHLRRRGARRRGTRASS
jgi:hypothetical protein